MRISWELISKSRPKTLLSASLEDLETGPPGSQVHVGQGGDQDT